VAAHSALLKEIEMLLHLPIAILASFSPITVSDTVPKFNIAKECKFEGGSTAILDRCSRDEAAALQQLRTEWPRFAGSDRTSCLAEATSAGFASYVELIICLEMARDTRDISNPRGPLRGQSTSPAQPEMSIVDRHE
jgi:hypothetical protein